MDEESSDLEGLTTSRFTSIGISPREDASWITPGSWFSISTLLEDASCEAGCILGDGNASDPEYARRKTLGVFSSEVLTSCVSIATESVQEGKVNSSDWLAECGLDSDWPIERGLGSPMECDWSGECKVGGESGLAGTFFLFFFLAFLGDFEATLYSGDSIILL